MNIFILWGGGFLRRVEVKSSDVSEDRSNSKLSVTESVLGYLITLTMEAECSFDNVKHQTLHDAETRKKKSVYQIYTRNGNLKNATQKSNILNNIFEVL
jgi:hypothetical protein